MRRPPQSGRKPRWLKLTAALRAEVEVGTRKLCSRVKLTNNARPGNLTGALIAKGSRP